ncbi:uncharacterized protein LOC125233196 [Leguminivora glycinivorella]|uniref:uncharacterized protein LOC125233196 n=1 Tax=Leguminivora glycinivorella TaxID=1035111 RepID=UPI00200DB6C3|nr:uncharacterized protein LOC125233196 [Leguminivora glycinivorella]
METKNVFENRVKSIFENRGFSEVSIQHEIGPEKGLGVVGNISHAKICAVKDGVPQEIDVVIKSAPNDLTYRKTMPVRNWFLREVYYYDKIAPVYAKLQDELSVTNKIRCFFPKYYGSCNKSQEEFIILEDLTKRGFCVSPLHILDYDHAAIMVRNIAKLHALSFINEERNPKVFREMADDCIYILLVLKREYDEKYILEHAEKTMDQFTRAITDASLRQRFQVAAGTNAIEKCKQLSKLGKIKAILHGDNWLCNHMFKYEDGKPTEGMPMDFQWSMYSSIGYDFIYLYTFAVSEELRNSKFYHLVDEYYAELKSFLAVCGYDVKKFCSYEQLKDEIKGQALISCLVSMIATPFFKNPGVTLPDMLVSPSAYAVTEEYKSFVNDMITAWANLGFI